MDKTELLFMMMEHPEQYSDQQWHEILMDKECHELFIMMSKVKSAIDIDRLDQQMSDGDADKQWELFQARHHLKADVLPLWRKVAAAILVAIAFCGITVAAVHHYITAKQDAPSTTVDNRHAVQKDDEQKLITVSSDDVDDMTHEPRLYDNVPLEKIINDLAANYGVQVEWQIDEVRQLRLYYKWEPSYSLDKVVEMLNSFESFSITRNGDMLVISGKPQDK